MAMFRGENIYPNNIQTAKASHTVAAPEILGVAVIPIVWPIPFPDTNYTIVFNPVDKADIPSFDLYTLDIHDKTAFGFNAVVHINTMNVGDKFIVNALGIANDV